jgi:1-acyl-sn-glycerol-3-phosphate acyltransferase
MATLAADSSDSAADDARTEESLADRWSARRDRRVTDTVGACVRVLRRYHPITLEGVENLPPGPCLLVGNHGLLGYESLFFFEALYRQTGRLPVGLADRWFFRVPLLRDVLVRIGGTYGHRLNARAHLLAGDLVVCYPGGAREAFKTDDRERYRLRWEQSVGFVRVAMECGVPLVPFAAAGVDDTFDIVGRYEGLGRRWMGHDKYDIPRLRGRANLPIPRPAPFLFRVGEPLHLDGERTEQAVEQAHAAISARAQRLLDDTVTSWREATRCGF